MCGRAIRLKRIDPDLTRSIKIVAWLRKKWRDMADGAFPLVIEDFSAALSRALVETALSWIWRRNRQLIEVKRGQFRGHPVGHASGVAGPTLRSDWILLGIAESGMRRSLGHCIARAICDHSHRLSDTGFKTPAHSTNSAIHTFWWE